MNLSLVVESTGDEVLDKINAKVAEIQARLSKLGLENFHITVRFADLREEVAAQADLGNAIIYVNKTYMEKHEATMLDEVIPHEVIHHHVYENYGIADDFHGEEFMKLCKAVDVKAFEYHTMHI